VSKTTLPEEFQEQNGYKLQFVVFSRLAPEQTTAILREHLPGHEAWLKGLGKQLAFHGPFLNAEASGALKCNCKCWHCYSPVQAAWLARALSVLQILLQGHT
jgi:hypothetical protein